MGKKNCGQGADWNMSFCLAVYHGHSRSLDSAELSGDKLRQAQESGKPFFVRLSLRPDEKEDVFQCATASFCFAPTIEEDTMAPPIQITEMTVHLGPYDVLPDKQAAIKSALDSLSGIGLASSEWHETGAHRYDKGWTVGLARNPNTLNGARPTEKSDKEWEAFLDSRQQAAMWVGRWLALTSLFKYKWWVFCGNACGIVWPYGFVPEAGCRIHDPDNYPLPPPGFGPDEWDCKP